jgi:tetratricopeptide (TPR) repeat protein
MRLRDLKVIVACAMVLAPPLHAQKAKLLVPLDSLIARAARDSNDAPAHYEVALGYWLAKKYDEAEKQLREAIAIDPHNASAYLALSYLPYARSPRVWKDEDKNEIPEASLPALEEAYRLRRRAFLLDPLVDLKPLALMIPTAESFGLGRRAANFYKFMMNGFGSFWDGRYDEAYTFFSSAAQGSTEEERRDFSGAFLWYEGLSAAHVLQYDRALADVKILLDRAVAKERPESSAVIPFWRANESRYNLGVLQQLSGRYDQALATLQEALATDLGLYPAHVRLALVYEAQHKVRSALEERRRALAANPDDPVLQYELGEALARAGEFGEAYAALDLAAKLNPRNPRALYLLAAVADKMDDRDAAKSGYVRFLAMAPSRLNDQIAQSRKRLQELQ